MLDEKHLAEQCKASDTSACRELYTRYAGRLLSVCTRYLGDVDEAEDVLQETFVKIFQTIGKFTYKGEGSLLAWMTRMVVNASIDVLRKRGRNGTVSLEEVKDIKESEVTPEGVRKIPLEVLTAMISELPEGYRTVFNMFCLEGYSHKEIAAKLGIREKSSSSQYFRARAILAEKINEYLKKNE